MLEALEDTHARRNGAIDRVPSNRRASPSSYAWRFRECPKLHNRDDFDFRVESARSLSKKRWDRIHIIAVPCADLDVTLDIDASYQLEAHAGRLVQAFTNILKNAVEASPSRADRLSIHAAKTAGRLVLAFRDEGAGMSPTSQAEYLSAVREQDRRWRQPASGSRSYASSSRRSTTAKSRSRAPKEKEPPCASRSR